MSHSVTLFQSFIGNDSASYRKNRNLKIDTDVAVSGDRDDGFEIVEHAIITSSGVIDSD